MTSLSRITLLCGIGETLLNCQRVEINLYAALQVALMLQPELNNREIRKIRESDLISDSDKARESRKMMLGALKKVIDKNDIHILSLLNSDDLEEFVDKRNQLVHEFVRLDKKQSEQESIDWIKNLNEDAKKYKKALKGYIDLVAHMAKSQRAKTIK